MGSESIILQRMVEISICATPPSAKSDKPCRLHCTASTLSYTSSQFGVGKNSLKEKSTQGTQDGGPTKCSPCLCKYIPISSGILFAVKTAVDFLMPKTNANTGRAMHSLDTRACEQQSLGSNRPDLSNTNNLLNPSKRDKRAVQGMDVANIILDKPTTPINKVKLEEMLEGYDVHKVQYLLNGFTFGFKLGFAGKNKPRISVNLRSALENKNVVSAKVQTELQQNRIGGPFPAPPLPNFCVSPIGGSLKNKQGNSV